MSAHGRHVAVFAALVLSLLAGNPVNAATPPDSLDELSSWLAEREATFDDLREGTEKQVVWYDGVVARRPWSLVYLHGFSASRQETRPLADHVARALGANLFYTRLTGHGRSGEALAEASVEDWLEDATEALAIGQALGERVVIVACSTGATVATALAMAGALDDAPVAAMVFVSPNFGLANRSAGILLWPGGETLAKWLTGPEREFAPHNDDHARYWTQRYPITAVTTMMRLMRQVERGDPSRVQMPVLTFFSPADQVLNVAALQAQHRRFPNPRNRLQGVESSTDPGQHVIAGDILSPTTTDPMAEQIKQFLLSLDRPGPG